MALSLVRLEAEGHDLAEVVKDIDSLVKGLKLPKDLVVTDEHYERTSSGTYKGRRVFRLPIDSAAAVSLWSNVTLANAANSASAPHGVTYTTVPTTGTAERFPKAA